ncbi:MAG TPA: NADH-quinone oxidoreductase subunit L, partial [Microbacterium sp.]|nr:NADH-quinone oxidoreductase subunit L [Microbacterium sp.]
GKRFPKGGSEVGVAALFASWVLSCGAFYQWVQHVDEASGESEGAIRAFAASLKLAATAGGGEHAEAVVEPIVHHFTWFQNAGVNLGVGIQIDGLAVMMMFVVTTISLLVHVYSTEYMRNDRRYTYFFAALSLFTASMLLLVVADNTLQLLVGWELVGLCSFMLIGHWWEEKPNSDAALKAFLTTRTGDIGLICGVIMTFFIVERATGTGSFNIVALNEAALSGKVGHTLLLMTAIALMAAIVGKSGQFPLHTWLPDAMAGPTPVSALIHAATMVVAGVYLGARLYGVFFEGFSISDGGINAMALVGGVTILIGAALAFVQDDIKKVLAYSTISQLGYMVMGLGVGAWVGAVFHLFTHAFFKALLFLGAGSVSHSGSHHSFDMKKDMGGLRKFMPITYITFMIGSLALAGVFPLAGFWSKDEILATAGQQGFEIFMVVGLIGAVLTAAYMTRCVYLTFFGEYRGHAHPEEAPRAITGPLIVLAGFSILAGLANATAFGVHEFTKYVEPTHAFPEVIAPDFDFTLAAASFFLVIISLGIASVFWLDRKELQGLKGLTARSGAAKAGHTFLLNKYYLDHFYEGTVVRGIREPLARAAYWVNQNVIDGVVNGVGKSTGAIGRFMYRYVDQDVVDGAVNGIANETGQAGGLMTYIQTGRVQRYALILFASVGLLALLLVIFS